MRRRRPAPLGDKGASVVPLSRAHRGRTDSDVTGTAGATAFDIRDEKRSKFGELTPTPSSSPDSARQQRPTGPRAPARARRAKTAAQSHDGWTFVLVPPGADARPRTLRVSVRRLRFVIVSFSVLFGSTALTGGLLVLALSILPPAQDEVRGVELGVLASASADAPPDSGRADTISPAGIAAASAGAAAPRTTARPRLASRMARRPDEPRGGGSSASPGIMESLPVVGEITSRFARARRHPLLGVVRKHAGIDIAAPAGTHITAPAPGRVKFSGKKFGYGYTVEIDHGNGVVTRYAHCRSLMVRSGDEVAAGAVIATVGRSGLATAPHLHYEILVHSRSIDPLRNPLASVLQGKQPVTTSAPPQPTDSALRAPETPDAIPASDVPEVTLSADDTIALVPPIVTRMSSVVTSVPASPVPPAVLPPAAVRDTARKS
jgi:murein DD-endopeptidase MepM/ murein hydrolase activator NlpD